LKGIPIIGFSIVSLVFAYLDNWQKGTKWLIANNLSCLLMVARLLRTYFGEEVMITHGLSMKFITK
jgi:hypothetical protein